MNEKLVMDELRTIKLMCIANFIELQEIRRKLDIAEEDRDERYEYANNTADHLRALDRKMHRLIKDDLPHFWEWNAGKSEG